MSTRASIKFTDGDEEYFIYRHHDGFPENVLPDLDNLIKKSKGRWSGSEAGQLVTLFLCLYFNPEKQRLASYELTTSIHGDESYYYQVKFINNEWIVNVTVNK